METDSISLKDICQKDNVNLKPEYAGNMFVLDPPSSFVFDSLPSFVFDSLPQFILDPPTLLVESKPTHTKKRKNKQSHKVREHIFEICKIDYAVYKTRKRRNVYEFCKRIYNIIEHNAPYKQNLYVHTQYFYISDKRKIHRRKKLYNDDFIASVVVEFWNSQVKTQLKQS